MISAPNFHEKLNQGPGRKPASDRAFGFMAGAVLAALSLVPLVRGQEIHLWLLAASMTLLVTAAVRPSILTPLNRGWFRLGLLLGRITNPVVMAIIFVGGVMPTALLMRIMGRDPMHRRFDRTAKTYWIDRRPPGPPPEGMQNQF